MRVYKFLNTYAQADHVLFLNNEYIICDTKKLEIKYYDNRNEINNHIIVKSNISFALNFNNFDNINIQIVNNILNSLINRYVALSPYRICYNYNLF